MQIREGGSTTKSLLLYENISSIHSCELYVSYDNFVCLFLCCDVIDTQRFTGTPPQRLVTRDVVRPLLGSFGLRGSGSERQLSSPSPR